MHPEPRVWEGRVVGPETPERTFVEGFQGVSRFSGRTVATNAL